MSRNILKMIAARPFSLPKYDIFKKLKGKKDSQEMQRHNIKIAIKNEKEYNSFR